MNVRTLGTLVVGLAFTASACATVGDGNSTDAGGTGTPDSRVVVNPDAPLTVDALGTPDAPGTPDDYDAVARELHALVTDPETSVERVAAYLRWIEREQMGLQRRPGMATGAAERVMALRDEGGGVDGG